MRLTIVALLPLLLTPAVLAQATDSTPPATLSQPATTSNAAPSSAPATNTGSLPPTSDALSQSSLLSGSAPSSATVSASATTSGASAQPTVGGCLGATFGDKTDYFPDKVTPGKDAQFSVVYNSFYKLVTNIRTNEIWMVYCSAAKPNTTFNTKGFYQVPLNGNLAVVDMSIIGYLDLLGLGSKVKYVGDTNNITSPCTSTSAQNFVSSSPPSDVDLVFQKDMAPNSPTYVTTSTTEYDMTPLQRAEWIKYYAALTNTEAVANDVYSKIEAAYNCHQKNIASSTIAMRRKITFTAYDGAAQAWTFPNTTYHTTLSSDAGGQLWVPPQLKLFGSDSLHGGLQNTSLLVDSSPMGAKPSYQTWITNAGYDPAKFASAESAAEATARTSNQPYVNPYDAPPFLRYNRLYRPDLTENSHASWDFTSRSPARADLVLLDLIMAQFPSYQTSSNRNFLRLLSPNSTETPHDASYQCPPTVDQCSSSRITDTQTDNPLLTPEASGTLSTTTKVILGVVGGMVALAIVSGGLVHLRRRIKDRGLSTVPAGDSRGGWKGVSGGDDEAGVPEGRF